jgi:hypothetical protein
MRLINLMIFASICAATGAHAQGVKDPANYGASSTTTRTPAATDPSRPTSVWNVPANSLPSGVAVQRVYKDGKLQNVVR